MATLTIQDTLRERAQATTDVKRKVAIYSTGLVHVAADLTVSGPEKHEAVVDSIIRLFLDDGVDLKKALDDLLDFEGFPELASDAVIKILPIETVLRRILGWAVEAAYEAMKGADATL